MCEMSVHELASSAYRIKNRWLSVLIVLSGLVGFSGGVQAAVSSFTASPVSPSTYGQLVTFTATVTQPNGSNSFGVVTFTDNGTNISGCVSLVPSGGTVTCSVSTLAVGSHPIVATQYVQRQGHDYQGHDYTDFASITYVVNAVASVAASIPTLQEWALMLMGLLLGGLVWYRSQRKGNMTA